MPHHHPCVGFDLLTTRERSGRASFSCTQHFAPLPSVHLDMLYPCSTIRHGPTLSFMLSQTRLPLTRYQVQSLFIVDRGVCAKKGKICLVGSALGEDMIISSEFLRDQTTAIALTFVQAVLLSRDSLFELLPEFPRAYRVIRRAAYMLALRRFVVMAAESLTEQQKDAADSAKTCENAADTPRLHGLHAMTKVKGMTSKLKGSVLSKVDDGKTAPTVNDAVAALRIKQKEAEERLAQTSAASAMLMAPVNVSPYQSDATNRRPSRENAGSFKKGQRGEAQQVVDLDGMSAKMAEHSASLAALKDQVGGVNGKLDALQMQMEALLVISRPKPRQKSAPSLPRVRSANGSKGSEMTPSPLSSNPIHSAVQNDGDVRSQEMQEMREAEDVLQGQTGAALRSTPFEA